MTPTECPSPFVTDTFEAVCRENVLGERWIAFQHPKNDKYDPKTAALFSEYKIAKLTIWLMNASRWVSERDTKESRLKKQKLNKHLKRGRRQNANS